MGTRNTYQKVLLRACSIAGDETALAKQLDVPVGAVVSWLLGDAVVPSDMFLKAVDIVLSASRQRVEEARDLLEKMKQRHR